MPKATIKEVLLNPAKIIKHLGGKGFFKWLPDDLYLKICYKASTGKSLDLRNPQGFNEKLQWLKLYDHNPIYSTMVDKAAVKKYVADIIGEQYIIPTYGVWDKFEDINFDLLPNQFVLKCTHDSGGLVICKDKTTLNLHEVKKKIEKSLKRQFFYVGREWPYKNVKPRIIAEKYMEDSETGELRDYKFFCFNGRVHFFKVDYDRFLNHGANYFDRQGKVLPFGEFVCPPNYEKNFLVPSRLDKMIGLSEKLSRGTKFLRVDFYQVNEQIYFGELTFFPDSGFGLFNPKDYDVKIGKLIEL